MANGMDHGFGVRAAVNLDGAVEIGGTQATAGRVRGAGLVGAMSGGEAPGNVGGLRVILRCATRRSRGNAA